jgi:hypothetical protein
VISWPWIVLIGASFGSLLLVIYVVLCVRIDRAIQRRQDHDERDAKF